MALPGKKRGFRKITVNGKAFNWRFDAKIDIRPADKKNNKLLVDFGWYDVLLYPNNSTDKPEDFQPKVVTPAFVHQSILFAIENGWDTSKDSGIFALRFKDGFYFQDNS